MLSTPKPSKAEADNTVLDLHNSSYHTKAVFNNCSIIYLKYFQSFKKDKIYFKVASTGFWPFNCVNFEIKEQKLRPLS